MSTDIDKTPEQIIRGVIVACADCDSCRYLMEDSCLFFPELYRLFDREMDNEEPASDSELRELANLCTLCDLCPCPNIREEIIRAKTAWVQREGFPFRLRLLADVQEFGSRCSHMPAPIKRFLQLPLIQGMAKKVAGIHPERQMPQIPEESFFSWASRQGMDQRGEETGPKVAYFSGCTAGYLFPEVAKSAAIVLKHNHIPVYVPPQQCCGMPTMLEGERETTLQRAKYNLESLQECASQGYDPVCTCPTCGYLFKALLQEKAVYSRTYQDAVGADENEIKVPRKGPVVQDFLRLNRKIYGPILKDDGYFAGLDPMQRIALSQQVKDMGEYLHEMHRQGTLKIPSKGLEKRIVYFAPCHQREQNIGSPYADILAAIPGLKIEQAGGSLDCCGMGGSLGMKKDFYRASLRLGRPLINKIQAAVPQAVVTDCLSCRLQFEHLLPYPVYHPLEILRQAYGLGEL